MTARDRTVVMVLGLVAMVAAFWFLMLSPKNDEVTSLKEQIGQAQTRLTTANAAATQAEAAKATYARDYNEVAKLGKAVPGDDDVPSLVFQLQTASKKSGIDFDSIKLTGAAVPAAAPVAATATGQVAGLAKEQNGAKGTSTPAAPVAPAPVAATQTAFDGLPPGAAVGTAGIPTMPFEFQFSGPFLKLEKLLRRIKAFTKVSGGTIKVNGRLMTVDSIALTTEPTMKAVIKATAFVLPADQGLTNGATPAAPAAGTVAPATAQTAQVPTPSAAAATPAAGVGR